VTAAGSQALGDVRVVCLSALGPVPFATMLLGDLAELRKRGTFVDWGGVPQPAPAPRLPDSAVIERPRSRWCGHTDQILGELGYPADEIAVLRADKVVA
jgi:crotonobetainyl-CoA:carnitine CoA-transferase CaiB-like acyl-CoA transferase